MTDEQKTSEIMIGDNDVVGGVFENDEIEIIKTWEELGVEPIYRSGTILDKPKIEFSTTIKPMDGNIEISQGGPQIFLGWFKNSF